MIYFEWTQTRVFSEVVYNYYFFFTQLALTEHLQSFYLETIHFSEIPDFVCLSDRSCQPERGCWTPLVSSFPNATLLSPLKL